jgi:uncharacterized RDD family membrane protein YckC
MIINTKKMKHSTEIVPMHDVALKLIDGVTYCSTGFACVMSFLDKHAAGIGVLIAVLTYITSTSLNLYWKKKHYRLEKERIHGKANES